MMTLFYLSLALFVGATIAYFITSAPLAPFIELGYDAEKKSPQSKGDKGR
jgi:hypothetical protein